MSRVTKRKHVTKEVLEELVVPEGEQLIVKILGGRGNNLHEAETSQGVTFLVSMPMKFRRNVWIKRGDFVIVDPIAEGRKVQAEITHILYPMQIKHLKERGIWPSYFEDKKSEQAVSSSDVIRERSDIEAAAAETHPSSSSGDEESDLFVNTNRQPTVTNTHNSSSDEN